MGRCDCTIGGIRGENNIGGREEESRWHQPQDAQREEAEGGKWMARWMDERGSFNVPSFFFCVNGISRGGNCLVCEVMTHIQGNYETMWLWKEGMWVGWNPHTNRRPQCRRSDLLSVSDKSQSSSYWYLWTLQEGCRHVQGNISVSACCYMYVWSWIQEVLDSVAVLLWQKWGGGTAAVIIDASWINGTHSQSNSFCVESVSFVCFTWLASLK